MELTPEPSEPNNPHVVAAAFYEEDRVAGAVRKLKQMGFSGAQIGFAEDAAEQPADAEERGGNYFLSGAISGGLTGGFVGGMFGLLMGVGLLESLSWVVAKHIAAGMAVGMVAGAALGGAVGCLAALGMGAESQPSQTVEPHTHVVIVSVEAGIRDDEAKSALIESGGDLSPTNALEAKLL